jgi:hypothetical protein
MKALFFTLASLALFIFSCAPKQAANEVAQIDTLSIDTAVAANAAPEEINIAAIPGSYSGLFKSDVEKRVYSTVEQDSITVPPNKITVFIQTFVNGIVKGYSVVAGNQRPFEGTYQVASDYIEVVAAEPGDDQYDGEFRFKIARRDSQNVLEGLWKPFKTGSGLKTYALTPRTFKYDKEAGPFAFVSQRKVFPEDVEDMVKSEIRLARNSIYARHGYSFKMRDVRIYFDQQDWYMPVTTDVRGTLTSIEKENMALLKRYEEYAAEYYDEYGR